MKKDIIICPMCGCRYNVDEQAACQACPINKDCQMVCCPVCGYKTIDTAGSKLAGIVEKWFNINKKEDQANNTSS